jgi:hypothetical protein
MLDHVPPLDTDPPAALLIVGCIGVLLTWICSVALAVYVVAELIMQSAA